MFTKSRYVAAALLLASPLALAQFSFPDCANQCVDQSTDDSCSLTDVKCICRQSNGRFLPDLVTCMKSECNDALSVDELLGVMERICDVVGTPISDKALDNARNMDSASPVTTTVFAPSPSFTTVTTKQDSQTVILVSPVTASPNDDDEESQSTVTRFPPGTTVTETRSSGTAAVSLVPVIIVSVDDDGNTQTATSTQTVTQTESAQETSSTSDEDDDAETTSTVTSGASTTTAEATATTSAPSGDNQSAETTVTQTSGAPASTATQSADRLGGPFSQQPEGAASRGNPAAGLGLTVALFVAGLFY